MPYLAFFFFFNDTATTEIYTLSLHDALPIYRLAGQLDWAAAQEFLDPTHHIRIELRSEEHTSELQSQSNLVCRLLLEKKKKKGDENKYTYADISIRCKLSKMTRHLSHVSIAS